MISPGPHQQLDIGDMCGRDTRREFDDDASARDLE
jgi:hypothetical protein